MHQLEGYCTIFDIGGEPRTRATLRFSGRLLAQESVVCDLNRYVRSPQPVSAKSHRDRLTVFLV